MTLCPQFEFPPGYERDGTFWITKGNVFAPIMSGADLLVLFAGQERCKPDHFSEGVRYHHLWHFVFSGKGVLRLGSRSYDLGPGDLFAIPSQERHYYRADSDEPWHYGWVGFTGTRATSLVAECGFSTENPVYRNQNFQRIGQQFLEIFSCIRDRQNGHDLKVTGLLWILLSMLKGKSTSGIQKDPKTYYVEKTVEFIKNNYSRSIDVGAVADYIGYHRSYLSSLFSKQIGLSLRDYLVRIRMEKAKELLANSRLSVREIGASVGYKDYFVFEKRFKKSTGKTPSAWRDSA